MWLPVLAGPTTEIELATANINSSNDCSSFNDQDEEGRIECVAAEKEQQTRKPTGVCAGRIAARCSAGLQVLPGWLALPPQHTLIFLSTVYTLLQRACQSDARKAERTCLGRAQEGFVRQLSDLPAYTMYHHRSCNPTLS